MKEKKKKAKIYERLEQIISMQSSTADPNGSYTGVPINPNEQPIQDADDL